MHILVFVSCTKKQNIPSQLQFHHHHHSTECSYKERPFFNLAPVRPGVEFSSTICVRLSRQIISRLSRRQWQPLSQASFQFYYGIWQGAGPTPQSCSLTAFCGATTSLPIWSTPSLHPEHSLNGGRERRDLR